MAVYGRLGELSDEQLQAALDRFGAGWLLAAAALTDGLFGKNVALTTDRGEWVLRGDPWPMHVDDQFRRERLDAYEDAAAVTVPRDLLRTYVAIDLLVIWAYGTRPENSWFDDPTFESWATKHPAIGG